MGFFLLFTGRVALSLHSGSRRHGIQSANYYTHFSLLRTLEGGFGLPCLNHACDSKSAVMSDLFGRDQD